ncbi:restriction endonuclease subunit S [Aeromonas enteropelogenes]|uniref:restriction endonuclease subunit S n=1 Tax=Aeromonas enteropelogenes TaxID=29489 RepID=UPI003BA14A6C
MKAGWHKKKLGDVLKLEYGKPLDATNRNPNGLYPVYGANGEKDRSDSFFYDKPSIIVGRKGSAGEVNLTEERFWPLDVTYYVTFDEKNYDLQFLYYLLLHLELPNLAKGVKPGINRNEVYSLSVNISSLPEQQRIVAILDEAFEAIAAARANAEQNRQNARALFESYLQSVFSQRGEGWVIKQVKEISKHSLGKMLDKAKNKGDLQPYLRNLNVRWFEFNLSDVLQMPFLPEETEKYTAIKGDVLICEGGYPGRAAIWNEDHPIFFQKALHRVRFHEPEHNKWFLFYLFSQDRNGELKQHFNGAGIQHFTGAALAKFHVPVPPLPFLRAAVARFEELQIETQRLESLYQRKIAALDELKQSLLQQAFSGQL